MLKNKIRPVWFFFSIFCLCIIRISLVDNWQFFLAPSLASVMLGLIVGIIVFFFLWKSFGEASLIKKLRYTRWATISTLLATLSFVYFYFPYERHIPFFTLGSLMLTLSIGLAFAQANLKRAITWGDLQIISYQVGTNEIHRL